MSNSNEANFYGLPADSNSFTEPQPQFQQLEQQFQRQEVQENYHSSLSQSFQRQLPEEEPLFQHNFSMAPTPTNFPIQNFPQPFVPFENNLQSQQVSK